MDHGTIVQFLKTNPGADRTSLVSGYALPAFHRFISTFAPCCYLQAWDVTSGLEYLHTMDPAIIHGDLKGVSQSG